MKIFQDNKWHELNPADIAKLWAEVVNECGGEDGINDLIRKEKVTIIEDIIRVKKMSGGISRQHLMDINHENIPATFDTLYDQDIVDLEVQLAALSAELQRYMKAQVRAHNKAGGGYCDENDCDCY